MSDPLRTDADRSADGAADPDKAARIEQLLLSGLDSYFAGQYDQAINIWTRVAFLERGHSRARAYIDRARLALAERHRESEELLHRGVAAFDSGEIDAARELITRAAEQGAPQDVALVLLERLKRLGMPVASPDGGPVARPERRPAPARLERAPRSSRVPLAAAALVALLAAGGSVAMLGGVPLAEWLAGPAGAGVEQVTVLPPEPLPVPHASERVLGRARGLLADGRLHDALRVLDAISPADPLRADADRLRADVQRRVLEGVQ